jgi:amino acid transporter
MMIRVKHLLVGLPLPTHKLAGERLNKIRALAAFSPDALSSIAYANQEIYLGLAIAGSAGLLLSWPIALAIVGILLLVALSYHQTIAGYTMGGGSYRVASRNLGTTAGLTAAAALMIGYLLTVAVSLTAGVEAIASAFPVLWPHRVPVALALLAAITLLNLRGLRETGSLMAVPVYLFLLTYLPMLAYGVIRLITGAGVDYGAIPLPATASLTPFLVLRAFSSGCTALTGIEAISNGVPYFRPPEAKNAQRTLVVMALLMAVLFLGSVGLTHGLAVVAGPEETILSALARRLVGDGPAYVMIQATTLLILAVAANTGFAGFPVLAAALAKDRFLPFQLTNRGDRLVYANGMWLLAVASGALIVGFGGDTHALIPLFAVGVFLAFTLSQAGMVAHWRRHRGPGWQVKMALNGVGAAVTGVTMLVVAITKFAQGAWITILLVPLMVAVLYRIRAHYTAVAEQLSMEGMPLRIPPPPRPRVVVPVSGVHRAMADAVAFAQSISDEVTGLYIELEPGASQVVRERWEARWPEVPLVVVPSPYRSIVGPLLDFLDEMDRQHDDGQQTTLVLPEFVPARWWHGVLHNQTAWLIKTALLYRRRHLGYQRAIIDVPYHLQR